MRSPAVTLWVAKNGVKNVTESLIPITKSDDYVRAATKKLTSIGREGRLDVGEGDHRTVGTTTTKIK